ncbi:class I SAM-dependent methyltransferase [Streptomyces sp. NPDC001835]|uniref:class I SAM-dependent methyltransferase n=1 Tax=Streptomyces sp. NPDC001835 TaxID=3154528 RepID=UPI003324089C
MSPAPVLELGCGSGCSTKHLAVRGARAVGVDFSAVLVGEAVSAGAAYRACALWRGTRWTS